ncbi:S-layer homology domain-containing protein, partial [Candidatus Microthrix parvicella]|uniref:S-layer homology domain-containing protein n=1 Tax=Candidatus Neomicrothrix parvicella TaxID=41950 RepID=UPI00037A40CE
MGLVATLGAPAGAQGSSQPDTQDVADASCTAPAPHGLTDVPVGSYYDIAVGWLLEAGITQGTSPDKFSPSGKVTRAPMALFLWRAAGEPAPTGAHGFTDIPPNSSYETAVTWLIEQHITSGTGPGKYSPSNP